MAESAHQSINDTISDFAAALASNYPELPEKLMALSSSPNPSCHAVGLKVVAELVEIADDPSFSFETYLANFVQALFAIAKTSEAKDEVRQMAVEVLLCIVEEWIMVCYLNILEFAPGLVPILLEFMLPVEDDGNGIKQDNSAVDATTSRNYDIGKKGLSRLASEIGSENVKNTIFNLIKEYLKRDEWEYKLVATMAIKQTFKYLSEEGKIIILDEIVAILNVQLNHPQHSLRFATIQAFSQNTLNCLPEFRKSFAKMILPVLVNLFDDPSFDVQSHAVAVLTNFVQGTEKADLMPFADQFMERLLEGIKPEKPWVMREQCVKGIGVVAWVIEKEFIKFYSFVVPVVKGIIVASTTKEERLLRVRAVRCINNIKIAVGDEMAQADADEVKQALVIIASAGVEADDPLKEYIQKMFLDMCLTLKGEFVPYLQHVIPNLLKVLTIKPQPVNHEEDDVKGTAIVAGGRCTGLKDSETDEISEALNSLLPFVEILGAQFGEYLVPTAQSLLLLLASPLDNKVELLALTVTAEVFRAARELSPIDPAILQKLSLWVGDVLEKVLKDLTLHVDKDLVLLRDKTESLHKCLCNAGPGVLNAQQVGIICEKVFALLGESSQRRAVIAALNQHPENEVNVDQFEEVEQTLCSTLRELNSAVMSFHADLYLQTGAGLCTRFIETHLDPDCTPDDRALALYVCGDILEHLKDKGAPLWPTFASQLVEAINDPGFGVRRVATFGLIQAAKCPQFPKELIQKAADQLVALLGPAQAPRKAFLILSLEVVTALGAILLYRSSSLQPSPEQFFHLWISNLPVEINNEEGRRVHGDFVDLLVQKSPEILGPQNANLPKVAEICAFIYRTDFSTAKIDAGIRDFMQKIGFDVIYSAVGPKYDERLQATLKKICQDSQKKSDISRMKSLQTLKLMRNRGSSRPVG